MLATRLRSRLLFALLYFSEGAPIGYAWWALPTQLRADGVDISTISLLVSLLAIPWALKALWAPVIDEYRTARWTYRSWMLAAQLVMGLSLLPLAIVGPSTVVWLTVVCLVIHAFSAATQDVAIDALCISVLPPGERGRANGWMQAGMLLGRAMFGGGTLILLSAFGPRGGIVLLIAVVWSVGLIVARSPVFQDVSSSADAETGQQDIREPRKPRGIRVVVDTFLTLIRKRMVWYALGFALLSGAVFEGLGSVAGPLLVDSGETTETAGFFFAIPAVAAMALGALTGGHVSDRIGARKAVARTFAGLFAIVLVLSIVLVAGAPDALLLISLLSLVYLGIGLFTASSYALYMDASVPRYRATSFSAYMGVTNLCESWSALAVGMVVPAAGYGVAFGVLAVVSLTSLFFLGRLGKELQPEIS